MARQTTERENEQPVLKEKVRKALRKQEIDEDQPGTILRDFVTLLDFVGEQGLKTASKHYSLPQSRLDELNERMCRPVVHRLRRAQQRSFPHLNGLYLLLRASGLGIGVGTGTSGRLTIDPELLAAWTNLNPTERYFALLESWLIYGSEDILGEGRSSPGSCFHSIQSVSARLRHRKTIVPDDRYRGGIWYGTMEVMTLALMELFGWLRIDYGTPEEGKGVKATGIERLPFGDAMMIATQAFYQSSIWPFYDDDHPVDPGAMKGLFEPFFPQWQRLLAKPELPFRQGTYRWRVSLGRALRRIVAPADLTLDDLTMCILDAFDFDCDHLYCFELPDRYGRKLRIACPYEQDSATHTDEVSLGDLPLAKGGVMKFLFDYGDNWQFTVKLEGVEPHDPGLTHPKITDRRGDPPAQYDWDDEDEY